MSNARIATRFQTLAASGRKALIPFVTAGFPEKTSTVPVMQALASAGADIIELVPPFSAPVNVPWPMASVLSMYLMMLLAFGATMRTLPSY
jgi:hypothetical protein